MNLIDFLDPNKIQSYLDTVKKFLETDSISPLLVLLLIGIFFLLKPSNSGGGKNSEGGIIYSDLVELVPLRFRPNFLNWYRVCFWIVEFSIAILIFISFLFSKYIPIFLLIIVFLVFAGVFILYRQIIFQFLNARIRRSRYRKIFFVLLFLGALVLVISTLADPGRNQDLSFNQKRFSSGDHALVLQNPWLASGGDWKNTCKNFWELKTQSKFQEFIKKCPNDSEAEIYLDNSIAEDTAKTQNSILIKVAVSVPVSRDSGQGVFNALEILKGVSSAQQTINEAGGIQLANGMKGLLHISIIDDGHDNSSSEELEAQRTANFLVSKEDIIGVIGHFSSDATEAAAAIYQKYGFIAISPTSTAVRKTNSVWQFLQVGAKQLTLNSNIFRVSPNDSIAVNRIKDYIAQYNRNNAINGISKVAVIYERGSRYGELYKQYFKDSFSTIKGTTLNNQDPNHDECAFEFGAADDSLRVQECLKEVVSNADALLLVPSTEKADYIDDIIRESNKNPIRPAGDSTSRARHLLGGDSMHKEPFLSEPTRGMVVIVPLSTQKLNNVEMNWRAAMSYDATQALVKGAEGSSAKCMNEQSPTLIRCIRRELQSVLSSDNFEADGILGSKTVHFDEVGDREINADLQDKLAVRLCVQWQEDKYVFAPLNPSDLCS